MLSFLEIKNFVLIDHVQLDLSNGLNIISGESGSGKSLFLKSLKAILGEKTNLEWIKPGKDFCEVSAIFTDINKTLKSLLNELQIPIEEELTIRRVINKSNSHKIFINDTLVNLSKLQEIGEYLGDFVSQHQNQKLIKNKYQLEIVDSFYKDENLFEELSLLNSQKKELLNIKNALLDKAKFKDANLNFIDSQVREIQNAKLKTEDFEALKNLDSIKEKIKNKQQYQEIFDMFYSEEGILSLISKLKRKFNNLTVEEKELKNLEQLVSSSNDLSEFFNLMLSSVEEIQISEERISQIKKIQQRYGSDFNAVKEKLAILKKEYQQLNDIDAELATLDKSINKLDKECLIICEKISLIRKNNSKKLEKLISSHLQSLEMKGSSFEILFETIPMSNSGFDKITFTLSSNKGQKNRPINEIASGGELSRLTLAIYLSSDKLHHNFLVFDEIDAGVGGSTAFSIGAKLKDLASKQQVLCITHLAQIAAYNNQIIKVTKESTKKDTITQIVNITEKNEILIEISRMLGDSSQKGLELAKELVNKVN